MKLTTKLLLSATVVAGLSISAFAACATDVDFGGTKKITGLADGTLSGEAVHYGQVLERTEITLTESNASLLGGTVRVEKIGGICILMGQMQNTSGGILPATRHTYGTLPTGYRPYRAYYWSTGSLDITPTTQTFFADIELLTNGNIRLLAERTNLPAGKAISLNQAYTCQ